nr:DUF748 domain-containing protein [uncultured Pseudodesulfovibrio sp.]
MLSFIDTIPYGSPRIRRIIFWLLTSFIAYTLIGFFAVPPILKGVATSQIQKNLKRDTQIDDIYFNPFTHRLEVVNLRVKKLEGEGNLLSIDSIVAAPGVSSLWRLAPVVAYLHLDNFQLDITFFGDGKYSISDILGVPDAIAEDSKEKQPEDNGVIFPFALYSFEMTNAKITFDDRPHNKKHVISNLSLIVPFTSSFTSLKKEFTQPKIHAVVNGDPVELTGRTLPFDETLLTEFELGAINIDLNQYWQYIPIETPLQLKDGKFTSDISLFFERPNAQRLNLFLGGGGKLTDMELVDPKEKSVLSAKEITFEMERFSLGDKTLILKDVTLNKPYFKVIRNKDNTINWPEYFPQSKRGEAGPKVKTKAENEAAFVLDIRKVQLIEGAVEWEDRHVKNGFKRTFFPLSFTGKEISTSGNRPSSIEATAGTEGKDKGVITIKGVATAEPLTATVSVTGTNLPIPAYKSYINHAQPLIVDTGIAGFSANIDFKMEKDTPSLTMTDGTLTLRDIAIRKPDTEKPSLGLSALDITGASMSLKDKSVTVADVKITSPFAHVILEKNGQIDLERLLASEKEILSDTAVVEAAEETWAGGWQAKIVHILVEEGIAGFQDQTLRHPADLGINDFKLELQDLSTLKEATMPFSMSGSWMGGGSFSGEGEASILPLWSNGRIRLNGIGLRPFDEYLDHYTELLVAKGAAFANLKYSFKGGDKPIIEVTGDTALGAVSIKDTFSKNEIVGIDTLEVNSISFKNEPNALSIGEINLNGPRALIHFSEDGQMNFRRALRLPPPPPPVEGENKKTTKNAPVTEKVQQVEETEPFFDSFTIGTVNMTKGAVTFKDESVNPDFSTELTAMNLRLTDVDQSPEARPKVEFKANIGTTPVSMTGVINPVITPIYSDLAISVNGIGLIPLTPYTLKNLAYPIEKGRLYADISFKTENWLLTADNKFFIEQLVLGKKDKRPGAPNVPVEFGLSLLQDSNGNMELNLPIRGELNDPDFRIGGIVFRAIVSMLFKALASPFSLIGSMFGGGENMDFVVFEPGRHALDTSGIEKVETIIKALSERKKLTLEVDGVIDPVADKNGLIEVLFENKIKQQKYNTLPRSEQAKKSVADMVITPEEYEDLLYEAYADEPDEEGIKPTTLFRTDRQPVEVMAKFIRDRIEITDQMLHDLAMDRAKTVKKSIVEKQPELTDRVFLLDRQDDAKGKTGVPAHRADLGIN